MLRSALRTLPLLLAPLCQANATTEFEAPAWAEQDAALEAMQKFITTAKIDKTSNTWKKSLPKPPKLSFTEGLEYFWVLETSQGPIKIQLLQDLAPMHVSTVIYLSQVGFYDGISFHRVINRFMAQGGCPDGTGTGTPGFQIEQELSFEAKHDRAGTLSAANRGKGTPEGSQFFLTFGPTPHLDGVHTVYGYVVDGSDTLKKLEKQGSPQGRTRIPLSIEKASVQAVAKKALPTLVSHHDSDDGAIAGARAFISQQAAEGILNREDAKWKTKLPKPPLQNFTVGKKYVWNVMTNKGLIQIELMPEVAPMHVSATIYMTLAGFYDGLAFHRVIPGFMAQGGCPLGNGVGFPGFKMNRELDANVKHDSKGVLSAANLGSEGTDGSQFFLTFGPTPHLDGGYTVYGRMTAGEDVLTELEKLGSRGGTPKSPLEIIQATITIK
ncbi:MAG: peptidyl-prolyl cis-trans isomerase B (cyclophilin B) [Planctomycetota bacterium]|jgi:peptidyl-prolyl cis-trans isomerase B (cyclophilin B)